MNHNKVFEYTDHKGKSYKLIPFEKDLYFSNPEKYKVFYIAETTCVKVNIGIRHDYCGTYPIEILSNKYKEHVFTDNGFFYAFDDLQDTKFSEPGNHMRLWIVVDDAYLSSMSNLITIL